MQRFDRKIILTCAVTGNAPFNRKHPASNGQLVERARTILERLGTSLASAAEARESLDLTRQ